MRCRQNGLAGLFPLLLLGALAGCNDGNDQPVDADVTDGQEPDAPVVTRTLEAGGATLVVGDDGEIRLERGESVLVELALDSFLIGVVPWFDEMINYDPYYLEDVDRGAYNRPGGLEWLEPAAGELDEHGEGLALGLEYDEGRSGTIETSVSGERRFEASWTLPDGEPRAVYARLRFRVDPEERFYGLGEHFDHVEHRGRIRAMQIEPVPLESANNEAHVPIPLLIGTSGWGLYVDSRRPGVFAVTVEEEDVVQVTYGLGAATDEGLRFYFIAEDHPLDVTRHYYEITGYPGAIAPWALGPLIWRDEVDGQEAVEEDLRTIRELDLATTGYWIDRPYASAVNSFDFEPSNYGDPSSMMAVTHSLGFRMALWHTPYVDPDDEDSRPLHDHALANGFFPPVRSTALANWGPPLDYTNPDAYRWWQEQLQGYRDLGIEGYKLDYAEEVLVGAFGIKMPWSFYDGTDELTMHRGYQLLYHQVYAEMLPSEGGFLLCRAAVAGDQVNGTIIWPGDIDANFAHYGEEVVEDDGETYTAVGGLPAAVVAGSSLGPSGFPFFGSDTGGYRHTPPDRETYIRWFQHTSVSTVMQVGSNSNDLPWDLGEIGLDPEVLELYRTYARLHLRLFPYLWTYVQRLGADGRAIQRPLGLAHPELGEHPDDIYLLGDHLLAAPVVERGLGERDVPFPEGSWQDWWTGVIHEGHSSVAAPLETLPLFVRVWVPMPLLRPTIDTLNPVDDSEAIDSFATTADPLWVRIAVTPSVEESVEEEFVIYDGTGIQVRAVSGEGECADVEVERAAGTAFAGPIVYELVGGSLSEATYGDGAGTVEIVEVPDLEAFDGASAAWWSPSPGRIHIKLPAAGSLLTITIC